MNLQRLILVLVALAAVSCQRAETGLDKLHACTLNEGPTEAFCGQLSVYENREAKQGRKIDLKILVFPALRRDPKPDPIFFLAGGPGQAAATLAQSEAPLFKRFQTDRDIVLVDQRGTTGSNSLGCKYSDLPDEDYEHATDYPVDKVRQCMEELQKKADLTQYTTPIAMDDLDEVRQWLGYGPVNVWGVSYGTRAALTFLKRHDDSVRTVVLDSVDPPELELPLYMARDGQRAFDRMLSDCEKDKSCSTQFPNLRQVSADLFKTLKSRPRVKLLHPTTGKPLEMPLSDQMAATVVYAALYEPVNASLVPRLLWDAGHGNYQGLLSQAMGGAPAAGNVNEGMFLSVICSEDFPKISREDIARETTGRFFGTTMFDTRVRPCSFWPRGKIDAAYYEPARSTKPVLVYSGEDDPVTPPEWGALAMKELKNARQIVAPGIGHGVSMRGCAPRLTQKFFDEASTAGLDPKCLDVQHRPPFFVNYTGPAATTADATAPASKQQQGARQ